MASTTEQREAWRQQDVFVFGLIQRAKQGDRRAYEELYLLYYPFVMGFNVRVIEHYQDAEDLTALTFLTMLKKLNTSFDVVPGRVRYGFMFKRWLHAIATNLQLSYFNGGRSIPRARLGTGKPKTEWHRLSDVDRELRTATCSKCGATRLKRKTRRNPKGEQVERFYCRQAVITSSEQRRRKKDRQLGLRPEWNPPPARSVFALPVSPEWVLNNVVDAVSDFYGAPEDHPIWMAMESALAESQRRRALALAH